ncbi:MAG TPA: hypothetical protein VMD79_04590 [Solirubrobacteraceae bacterium]|nr:hypothetical protein [Solirubrobacteraceae bacterium]
MGQRTAADEITEAYCIERGYTVSEHEPDLGIGKRIEFEIESGDDGCLLEVKEATPHAWSVGSRRTAEHRERWSVPEDGPLLGTPPAADEARAADREALEVAFSS